MVPYQLPTGKTIFIDSYDLLFMTDLDEQELIANDVGCFINNPFHHSTLDGEIEVVTIETIPDIEDEIDFDI